MANFGVTPVDPNVLFKMLEEHVGGTEGLSKDRAFLSQYPDDVLCDVPVADQFVAITLQRLPVWQGVVTGGGREATGYNAVVKIASFTRLLEDEIRSTLEVSATAHGVLQLVNRVVSRVQFWKPVDDQGNDLLREYARLMDPGVDIKDRRFKSGPWSVAAGVWEIKFTALLP